MKKLIVSLAAFFTLFQTVAAQNQIRALTGNGKEKNISYDLKAFDMLEILWIDGKIEVEYGASKSDISINTDENIYNLLQVTNTVTPERDEAIGSKGMLKLELANNYKNRLWVEDEKTTIKIRTTAQPRQIIYKANANAVVKGINSPILKIEKDENGNLSLEGKVAILQINKSDNGSIEAKNLIAEQATVASTGNGDVEINAKLLTKQRISGNGSLYNRAEGQNFETPTNTKRVNITFYNTGNQYQEYYVTGTNERGRKFSYGLGLKGMEKKSEYLPVGTRIYRNKSQKLLATLKESDDKQEVRL